MSDNPFVGLGKIGEQQNSPKKIDSTNSDSEISRNSSAAAVVNNQDKEIINTTQSINSYNQKINTLIENVFMITINKTQKKNKQFIFMEDFYSASTTATNLMTMEQLEVILFERLLLESPIDYLIPNNIITDRTNYITEKNIIPYLYSAYERNDRIQNQQDTILTEACKQIKQLILRNLSTAIKQPELFNNQKFGKHLLDIFYTFNVETNTKMKFTLDLLKDISESDDEIDKNMKIIKNLFDPIFDDILKIIKKGTLVKFEHWIYTMLIALVSDKTNTIFAELLIDYQKPNITDDGIKYSNTIFGQLLSISILPKNHNDRCDYFENPINDTSTLLTNGLWISLDNHLNQVHILFKNILLMGIDVRNKLLEWFGNCLSKNKARGQILGHNLTGIQLINRSCVDSFFLGLCGVFLRLCKPLAQGLKILQIDPSYCAVSGNDERKHKAVHMIDLDKETCLVPTEDGEKRDSIDDTYHFITELFFMTHKALDLGNRACHEKYISLNREIHRLQTAYQEQMAQATIGGNSRNSTNVIDSINELIKSHTQNILALRYSLTEPNNDELIVLFYKLTSFWLTQITNENCTQLKEKKGYAPEQEQTISLPLKHKIAPKALQYIPEFIIENIINYLTFMNHLEYSAFHSDEKALNEFLTMILIFMGNATYCKNPHLRASLAEGLETILPINTVHEYKVSLLQIHPHSLQIVINLLHVFVSIEMTGQSVQFEQKFNYRRPMYNIIRHLWQYDKQIKCFIRLANESELNMEAVNPPIFLRFINLLINDAIFLLDESLSNLQQIRELQQAQDNGEWNNLSAQERQQNMTNLQHLGMIAKFDNILGRDTTQMLVRLTSVAPGIFGHSALRDRVASMLNYFLLNLVGPNKNKLVVKNKKEFEFDPVNTVLNICQIYINLSNSDSFCLAISQDGRSYSPELFKYAQEVLEKIADVFTGRSMKEFARKIARLAYDDKIHQESLIDAPDEFLDPILNSIMLEPVILPSSKITIDRSTIARHLLSDQTDPFNRSPLTMDQLKTDVNLKLRIEQWIHDKKEAYKLLNKSNHIENRFVDDVNDDSTQVVSELREAKNVDVDDSDEKNFK